MRVRVGVGVGTGCAYACWRDGAVCSAHSMSRGHCASSSLVGATGGPALRAGTRIASGKWPLPSVRGPETYGPGAATDRRPRDSTGAAGRHGGRALADKPSDGHDTVSVTAWRDKIRKGTDKIGAEITDRNGHGTK